MLMAETLEPTAEPTAAPTSTNSPVPTALPSTLPPTALPTIGAEFLIYDLELQLTDSTSDVLDAAATSALVESVAEASGVVSSDVVLDSYTAISNARSSGVFGAARTSESSNINENSYFMDALKRSLRNTFATTYTIDAILTVTAPIADFPQFNNNITALYNQLTTSLLNAAADNTLANLIRQNSIAAGSTTLATIGDVAVTEISAPIAQYYPTSAPTRAPVPDGQKYDAGEIAGFILLLLFGIGVCLAGVYLYCTRKTDRSEAYIVTSGADAGVSSPTSPKWTPVVVAQNKTGGGEFSNITDDNIVL